MPNGEHYPQYNNPERASLYENLYRNGKMLFTTFKDNRAFEVKTVPDPHGYQHTMTWRLRSKKHDFLHDLALRLDDQTALLIEYTVPDNKAKTGQSEQRLRIVSIYFGNQYDTTEVICNEQRRTIRLSEDGSPTSVITNSDGFLPLRDSDANKILAEISRFEPEDPPSSL